MYLCYIDESGTPEVPGTSSHFVLAGVSIPIYHWRDVDREVSEVLGRYGLSNSEIHTGWLLRSYSEQAKIPNFEQMSWDGRRAASLRARAQAIFELRRSGTKQALKQTKKSYRHTEPYIHLTRSERLRAVQHLADCVSRWGFARLFAECIDKLHFDTTKNPRSIGEQAFEQVVSRFERYLAKMESGGQRCFGLLVHDNNESVAHKHTSMMRSFHASGTIWTSIARIVETPFFVDSSLTRMVQIADLCGYALRRYVENNESELFQKIFARADRLGKTAVGVRHFAASNCACEICQAHRMPARP
jgi:hypothetical protein